jgi:hypothetical protein
MTFDLDTVLTLISAGAMAGFAVTVALWLKRLRLFVRAALGEAAGQQLRAAKHFSEMIEQLQKNQRMMEQQIHTLALAHRQLRQSVQILADRTQEPAEPETPSPTGPFNKTLH